MPTLRLPSSESEGHAIGTEYEPGLQLGGEERLITIAERTFVARWDPNTKLEYGVLDYFQAIGRRLEGKPGSEYPPDSDFNPYTRLIELMDRKELFNDASSPNLSYKRHLLEKIFESSYFDDCYSKEQYHEMLLYAADWHLDNRIIKHGTVVWVSATIGLVALWLAGRRLLRIARRHKKPIVASAKFGGLIGAIVITVAFTIALGIALYVWLFS